MEKLTAENARLEKEVSDVKESMAKIADGSDLGKEVASLHERVSALEKEKLDLTTELDKLKSDGAKSEGEGKSEGQGLGQGSGLRRAARARCISA